MTYVALVKCLGKLTAQIEFSFGNYSSLFSPHPNTYCSSVWFVVDIKFSRIRIVSVTQQHRLFLCCIFTRLHSTLQCLCYQGFFLQTHARSTNRASTSGKSVRLCLRQSLCPSVHMAVYVCLSACVQQSHGNWVEMCINAVLIHNSFRLGLIVNEFIIVRG